MKIQRMVRGYLSDTGSYQGRPVHTDYDYWLFIPGTKIGIYEICCPQATGPYTQSFTVVKNFDPGDRGLKLLKTYRIPRRIVKLLKSLPEANAEKELRKFLEKSKIPGFKVMNHPDVDIKFLV